MNQVYNNPLIIRNVEFKEYLTEEEALKKINEFRFSEAGQVLPDNKKISLKRIANYFVTHPNFDEVSDNHVLIREGYPIIFTSKNYKKIKYEKSVKRDETDGIRNNLPLGGDDVGENSFNTLTKSDPLRKRNTSNPNPRIRDIDNKPQILVPDEVEIMTTQESYVKEDISKSNKLKIATKKKNQSSVTKNKASEDHNRSNRVVISPPKKKKKNKKSINKESNAAIDKGIQGIELIQEINVERVNFGSSKQSAFNDDEKCAFKKNEAAKESDNSIVKKDRSVPTEKKSENEVIIRTSKKRTSQEGDKINVKKVKVVDPSNNSIFDEESDDINGEVIGERRIQGTPKVIDETGLIQGTAKVKGDPLKKKKKKKSKETNLKAIQGIASSADKISKVKNDKKESGSKNNKSISPKESISKDSTNIDNSVTINMKKKKKNKLRTEFD
ncbi:hypothetical protein C1645_763478 [Glomus cerebriforme]|uniref:Uncharacterized protein n=1 Tax=Glomus cerebriforme TaxID=658196 RepID=A0A397T9D8_9GLOM|nr:hypothetical protein C1645_763478 [Glomus cerebriforme]